MVLAAALGALATPSSAWAQGGDEPARGRVTSPEGASRDHAHGSASHYTYTGALRAGGDTIAQSDHVPIAQLRAVSDTEADVVVRHAGLRLEARVDRALLQYHLHAWTSARSGGFDILLPPGALLDVVGSRGAGTIVFSHPLGEDATLGRRRELPAWVAAHVAARDRVSTQCDAALLYPSAQTRGEPLRLDSGSALYRRASRGGWDEIWTEENDAWLHGYARDVRCREETSAVGTSASMSGSPGSWGTPAEVVLPRGLELVPPSHPSLIVLRVTRPFPAVSWPRGWSAAREEGALTLELPCGFDAFVGSVTFSMGTDLVPRGAPARGSEHAGR